MNELQFLEHLRSPYVFPGGYKKVFLMKDGDCMCMECARNEKKRILNEYAFPCDNGWIPEHVFINWEGEEYCSHCGKQIESEYES